jgi:hypothetical protein
MNFFSRAQTVMQHRPAKMLGATIVVRVPAQNPEPENRSRQRQREREGHFLAD